MATLIATATKGVEIAATTSAMRKRTGVTMVVREKAATIKKLMLNNIQRCCC